MQVHTLDPYWLEFDQATWLHACRRPGQGLLGFSPLLVELTALFPHPGHATHKEMPVVLRPGKDIAVHAHKEHLLIYYPFEHVCALLVDNIRYEPSANTAVYLPPGANHSVETNHTQTPRISVALRWRLEATNGV